MRTSFIISAVSILALPFLASAHVTVKPPEVKVGARQAFNVSVPVEKDIATIGVRLVIPAGLESVSPNVKPGWRVTMKKQGTGEDAVVTEINWTGGNIPTGMRDDFYFTGKAPAEAGTLEWKAYQTYADGTIVSWDASAADQPKGTDGEDDFSTKGPFSTTKIINDLAAAPVKEMDKDKKRPMHPDPWSAAAIGISLIAIIVALRPEHFRGKKHK